MYKKYSVQCSTCLIWYDIDIPLLDGEEYTCEFCSHGYFGEFDYEDFERGFINE